MDRGESNIMSTKSQSVTVGEHPARERFLSRLVDPLSSYIEAIYSVLIVLTFTMATRVADANMSDSIASLLVSQLFWACLGCAVAWGLIDGVMYILAGLAERGEEIRVARMIQRSADEAEAIDLLSEELSGIDRLLTEEERALYFGGLHRRLKETPLPTASGIRREDFAGALGTFLVAVLAALPVVLPLLLFQSNASLAVRLSNLIAFAMLFTLGYRWAEYAGGKPLTAGLFLTVIGIVVVLIAIPLGG